MNATFQTKGRSEPVRIAVAQTPEELEAVYRFRYRISIEEMGRVQHDADHAARRIRDLLDDTAINLVACQSDEVVGCCRVNLGQHGDFSYYTDFYEIDRGCYDHPDRTAMVTRLMVAPELRGTRVAVDFCIAAFEVGLRHNVHWCFVDCQTDLVRFFKALGFVEYASPKIHKEYGLSHRMLLDIENYEHLCRVRSPLRRVLETSRAETACNKPRGVNPDQSLASTSSVAP